jgi:hypothetical protein
MKRIRPEQVHEHLTPEVRRLGFSTHNLISDWDGWVKRRVEQVELISNAAARRRISVDFRLHSELFRRPEPMDGGGPSHRMLYVPLTLLQKAPFTNFDLRDECGTAIPLLTKKKTASIGGAILSAGTKAMVIRHLLAAKEEGDGKYPHGDAENPLTTAVGKPGFDVGKILVPDAVEAEFLNLCAFPWVPSSESDVATAKEIREELVAATMKHVPKAVHRWQWEEAGEGRWHAQGLEPADWWANIFKDEVLNNLIFDLARLYMVCAPVEDELERRRIFKLDYEEHIAEPRYAFLTALRDRATDLAASVRRQEDRWEGLEADDRVASREWKIPRSGMHSEEKREPPPQTLREAIRKGIGWLSKPITFSLPSVGFGGTFHLEVSAPAGTQLRRAELQAVDKVDGHSPPKVERVIARRYARNVTRAHLYLGGDRKGMWGAGSMAIKPKSSTVIRGAALSSSAIVVLLLASLAFGENLGEDSQTAIAILLLAPGIVAAVAGQPFEHTVTSEMVFGLRLLALAVAGLAVAAAALLSAHQTFCDQPILWSLLVLAAMGTTAILVGAWRLAARDWPQETMFSTQELNNSGSSDEMNDDG